MKFLLAFFYPLIFLIPFGGNAQDTIFTRDKYCFAAKIFSVDHKEVWFKYTEGETGILHHLRFDQLYKIKYEDEREKYFRNVFRMYGLGVTFYSNGISNRSLDDGKYGDADYSFSTNSAMLTYLFRGTVAGITLSTGYAYTVTQIQLHEFNMYPPYTTAATSRRTTNIYRNVPLLFSPRINLSISKTVAFFDISIGTEFYHKDGNQITIPNPFIFKTGFGVQFCFFKHWLAEIKAGFGSRSDFADNNGRKFLIGNFELSFYRILYSHITH